MGGSGDGSASAGRAELLAKGSQRPNRLQEGVVAAEAQSLELSASGEQETRRSSFFGGIKSPSGAPEVMAGLATPRVCTARLSPSVTGTCQ